MEVKRTERGWAGHCCLSNLCEYHRNTLLECNGAKVVVSTIGRLRDVTSGTFAELGYGSFFETMAFMSKENGDADVTRELLFESKRHLPSPDMELEADAMHEDVVTELSKRLVDGTLVLKDNPSILSGIEGVTEETAQRFSKICGQLTDTLVKINTGKMNNDNNRKT